MISSANLDSYTKNEPLAIQRLRQVEPRVQEVRSPASLVLELKLEFAFALYEAGETNVAAAHFEKLALSYPAATQRLNNAAQYQAIAKLWQRTSERLADLKAIELAQQAKDRKTEVLSGLDEFNEHAKRQAEARREQALARRAAGGNQSVRRHRPNRKVQSPELANKSVLRNANNRQIKHQVQAPIATRQLVGGRQMQLTRQRNGSVAVLGGRGRIQSAKLNPTEPDNLVNATTNDIKGTDPTGDGGQDK